MKHWLVVVLLSLPSQNLGVECICECEGGRRGGGAQRAVLRCAMMRRRLAVGGCAPQCESSYKLPRRALQAA